MVRAILEGIKFELRRTLEIVEQTGITANQIRATGGGAQNDVWNQVRADIYNKPVVTLAGEGAAWLELRSWPGWLLDYGLTPLPPGTT
jgi:xylulokinase